LISSRNRKHPEVAHQQVENMIRVEIKQLMKIFHQLLNSSFFVHTSCFSSIMSYFSVPMIGALLNYPLWNRFLLHYHHFSFHVMLHQVPVENQAH